MARDSERLFADDLANYLKTELLKELDQQNLDIVPDAKILSDLTCLAERNDKGGFTMRPTLSFLEQDIVIGYRVQTPPEIRKFFYRKAQTAEWTLVPRLIIEVKYEDVNSHTIMTYSEIAGRLKAIYRDLRYYFLIRAGSKDPWILERHGRNFDRIYQLVRVQGNRNKNWPGTYQSGQLTTHLQNEFVRRAIEELIGDIRRDLRCPRVRTTGPM